MSTKPPPKTRTHTVDLRHLMPLLKDSLELFTVRAASKAGRRHVLALGRSIRQHAFDARDDMPVLEHADLASFLGCEHQAQIVLPPIDVVSLSGLGFVIPYTLMATMVNALQPKKVFEVGTFRGAMALTMALNAPEAEIYTLDLPPQITEEDKSTLTKGDKVWVDLAQTSTGWAFRDHPAGKRIHQILANSLTYQPGEELQNIDFAFIDGGHSYECVKSDTEMALRLMSPNGVIVWDDYSWFVEGVPNYLHSLREKLPMHRIAGSQLVVARRADMKA